MTSSTGSPSDQTHFVDLGVALTQLAEGHYSGATHPAWGNMVGPFGGITAAVAVNAVLKHPKLLGAPISLTTNFATALADGAFEVHAQPVRTNRSTQHWTISITQPGDDGKQAIVFTATAVTAARRETWSSDELQMPAVPPVGDTPRFRVKGVAWIDRYDVRAVSGPLPMEWDGKVSPSLTQQWLRDDPPRPLDFVSVTALSDTFYPRVWRRRATRVPAGTVTMTIYFHADAAMLARTGTGYLLGQAQAQALRNGFFDQTAQLWNEAGELLITTHQLVYYKE